MNEGTKPCECGCGEPAPISHKTRPDRGVRRGEPQRFIFGHQASGPGRGPRGEADPRWRGDDASYFVKHEWLNRHFPKTGRCDQCGAEGKTHYALRHGLEYTRNREDYLELCPRCHVRYDDIANRAWTTRRRRLTESDKRG